uniref:Uncharacterized protein n=1 Tax=Strigamia maritima TaxID=126957 RepID=T1IR21_STRMM
MSCQLHRTICNLIPPETNESEFEKALTTLADAYNVSSSVKHVKFRDSILKFAYFYGYCACTTNCVKTSWEKFGWEIVWKFLRGFSRKGEIHVCCIGGGSGCDLLGLTEWLKTKNIAIKIHGLILDKYNWSKETLSLLTTVDVCNQHNLSNTKFRRYDFFQAPINEETKIQIGSADLVTIVKFVSAVHVDKKTTFNQFRDLFQYVKKNSFMQFVDNSDGGFWDIINNAAKSAGFLQICKVRVYLVGNILVEDARPIEYTYKCPLPVFYLASVISTRFGNAMSDSQSSTSFASIYSTIWSYIPQNHYSRRDKIEAIAYLLETSHEKRIKSFASRFEFDDSEFKHAYRCRFFTMYSSGVYEIWKYCHWFAVNSPMYWAWDDKKTWFEMIMKKKEIKLACIGECPGADIAGLSLWLRSMQKKGRYSKLLSSTVVDMYDWSKETQILLPSIISQNTYTFNYFPNCDIVKDLSSEKLEQLNAAFSECDIISIVNYLSMVRDEPREYTVERLKILLKLVQPGQLVFFMDHCDCYYFEIMNEAALALGFKCFFDVLVDYLNVSVSPEEEETIRAGHFESAPPQIEWIVCASLWQKTTKPDAEQKEKIESSPRMDLPRSQRRVIKRLYNMPTYNSKRPNSNKMNKVWYHPLIWKLIQVEKFPLDMMDAAIAKIDELYKNPAPELYQYDFDDDNDKILKYAFYYRFFVCITHAVKTSWIKLSNVHFPSALLENSKINVFCLGGGSGCELVGFCRYLDHNHIKTQINAVIYDHNNWTDEMDSLIQSIPASEDFGLTKIKHVKYDLSKVFPITGTVIKQIGNSDLITVVKFLSTIGTAVRLNELLSHLKQNAHLFFLDNNGGPYRDLMNKVASVVGLQLQSEIILKKNRVPPGECKTMADKHFNMFPMKSTCVCASLWKKI